MDNNNGAKMWTFQNSIDLIKKVEALCPDAGCHVALTGGVLYKEGERKDLDLLFYRIRQKDKIDMDALWLRLEVLGIKKTSGFGWCYKAEYDGKVIDCFFPEEEGGDYKKEEKTT